MAVVTALVVGIPLDLVTLFLTLVQTLVAVTTLVNIEEDNDMANGLLVVSGTHGVVQNQMGSKCYYKCRVGSNPARSAIYEATLLGGLYFYAICHPAPHGFSRDNCRKGQSGFHGGGRRPRTAA